MHDFDQFERRFAAALSVDADLSLGRFEPSTIARAAIDGAANASARRRSHPGRFGTIPAFRPRRLTFAYALLVLGVVMALLVGAIVAGALRSQVITPAPSIVTPAPSNAPDVLRSQPAKAASWSPTGNMLQAFGGHTATLLLNGKVLVASGSALGTADDTAAELYDPATGAWTATGSMLIAAAGGRATLLRDGRVLLVGGGGAAAQLYDPATGAWTRTGSMASARRDFSATLLLDGRVLVAGGEKDVVDGNAVEHASAELYDPATGAWTRTGSMAATRFSHTATLLPDGRVLVAGGGGLAKGATICCDPIPSAELYDPGSGTWTAAGDMTTGRVDHTATLLRDGRVLLAAGGPGAELYDPVNRTWTATEPMASTAVAYFSATLLPDGSVLLAGGWALHVDAQELAVALASAELYDPTNGTWTATASMASPRMRHTATLLPDGSVLVAGGSNPVSLASAELYDPGTAR